ncbi:MAG TPA: 23S rRNA (guanosine(2251)-2'-O)-methyltransferase RlmB [Candidatus Kaiserbacteria bacterium]|nr:23S rRNA (guanosine(2251)-2'-O)-methyltransferase RlmB [Candidatus Kaiserbacteria bacterium]
MKDKDGTKQEKIYAYGKHVLSEALRENPRAVKKVFLDPSFKDAPIKTLLEENNISTSPLRAREAGFVSRETVHQGVITLIDASLLSISLDEFLSNIDTGTHPALVLLDEIQDPHNVGAIIRSAAAFGIGGVLIPRYNQAGITAAVIKVSAGMVFKVPIIYIANVNHALRMLKKAGFWIYGLDGAGTQQLNNEPFDAPTVFVAGNEGAGIRKKTSELCDVLLSIPIEQQCESLNVASATAVAFYAWKQARKNI